MEAAWHLQGGRERKYCCTHQDINSTYEQLRTIISISFRERRRRQQLWSAHDLQSELLGSVFFFFFFLTRPLRAPQPPMLPAWLWWADMLLKQERVPERRQPAARSSRAGGRGGCCRKLLGHSEQAATSYFEDRANLSGRI